MNTPRITTRRTVLAIMGGAIAADTQAPASAAPEFRPEPTPLGRRYLSYLALSRRLWGQPGGIDEDDAASWARLDGYEAELKTMRAEIVARPVQSVSDMMDRLILAAHDCDTVWNTIRHESVWPALGGALVAAGINPHECCEDVRCYADDFAFPEA